MNKAKILSKTIGQSDSVPRLSKIIVYNKA